MADSDFTESYLPDLANSSFDSKYKAKPNWEDMSVEEVNKLWVMEEYPEDKINGTPQK
jgi:hypothetical protein